MHLTYCIAVLLLASFANAENDASKYTVAFHFEGLGYRCLGGIINDHYVLSVGECFADKWGKYIEVPKITAVAGAKDLTNVDGLIKSDVQEVFLPWFYAGRTQRSVHDFAIVKLKDSLNLAANGLVALNYPAPSQENNFAKVGVVGGYGLNSALGELKYEDVNVVDNYQECFPNPPHDDYGRHVQFCVKRKEGKCTSDRGSPYVDGNVLVGVQMKCNDNSTYELYKKVSGYSDLIPGALKDEPGLYSRQYYSGMAADVHEKEKRNRKRYRKC